MLVAKRVIISIFFISLFASTVYFFRPLHANQVFTNWDQTKAISFVVRFDEEQEPVFQNIELKNDKMQHIQDLFELPRYRRAFGNTNIQSQSNAYDMLLVQESSNYSILIYDQGFVIVDIQNNKKKYRILSSQKDTLMKLVDEMLIEE